MRIGPNPVQLVPLRVQMGESNRLRQRWFTVCKNTAKRPIHRNKPDIGTVIISHSGMAANDIAKNFHTEAPLSTTNSSNRML